MPAFRYFKLFLITSLIM